MPSGLAYEEIEETIKNYVEENRASTAGLAIGIFDHEKFLYVDYFGDINIEKNTPVSKDSVFEWGSVTKLLVWVSVMQLWEQGEIDLNKDIIAYLPDSILENLKYDQPITMHHLMAHQAGFQDNIHDLFTIEKISSVRLENSLAHVKMEQVYPPGRYTAYSNYGTALAAYIVEQKSGLDFTTYVHQHIFDPLGMKHTSISVDLSDNNYVKNQIKGYAGYNTNGEYISDQRYQISLYPAGYAIETLKDLLTFAQALVPKDKNQAILFKDEQTFKQMYQPITYFKWEKLIQNAHGLWGNHYQVPTLGHGGNTVLSTAMLEFDPESGIGMVVMTNQANEWIYTVEMYPLIFGELDQTIFGNTQREMPTGLFRPARTILKGPLSLYKMSYFTTYSENDMNTYWYPLSGSDRGVVQHPYYDFYELTFLDILGDFGITLFWLLGLIFSFFIVLIDGIYGFTKRLVKHSKNGTEKNNGSIKNTTIFTAIIQLLMAANVILLAYQVLTYQSSEQYTWQFVASGFIVLLLAGMILFFIQKKDQWRNKEQGRWKIILTVFFSIMTILFIMYFQLYQFWGI